jgi:hypothetical protein
VHARAHVDALAHRSLQRLTEIMVYMVGGITYEEVLAAHRFMEANPGVRVVNCARTTMRTRVLICSLHAAARRLHSAQLALVFVQSHQRTNSVIELLLAAFKRIRGKLFRAHAWWHDRHRNRCACRLWR